MKNTITKQQFLELTGIVALANHEMKILSALQDAALAITGEKDRYGYTIDAVWGDGALDARGLLRKLEITVKK